MTFAAAATGTNGTTETATTTNTGVSIPFRTFSGDVAAKAAYNILAEQCDGTPTPSRRECVRLVAVPNFTDTAVGNLRFTSTGIRDCTGTNTTICWR
jgi:type IV pilus assembly protein PilE